MTVRSPSLWPEATTARIMWQRKFLLNYSKTRGSEGSLIKAIEEDGWRYFALFDIDAADLINCGLYKVNNIELEFSEQDTPYFVSKHYDKK